MIHIDDYLSGPNPNPIAKEFLDHARRPSMMKDDAWLRLHRPYVTWHGKVYRCVGASRLGDVWLKGDGRPNAFYDYRVDIADLSDWNRPADIPS